MIKMLDYLRYFLSPETVKRPGYLIFHVTYKCNSRCGMCFLWKDLNKAKDKELSLNEIEKISSSLGNLFWLALGGGEPFLRDDLPDICRIFYKNNKTSVISIPTNGLLPKRIYRMTREILKNCDTRITIGLSLDGIKEKHDHIRGVKGNFEKVLKTYNLLSPLRKKYSNFSIGILTTLTNLNVKEIPKLYDFVRGNMNVDWHTIEIMRGDTKDAVKPPTLEQYRELMPKISKMNSFYSFGRGIKSRIIKAVKEENVATIYEILRKKEQVIPCFAGRINCVIDPYGNVQLCELLDKVGNLRDANFNFDRVWFSEKANKQRKFIKNKGCYCTHCIFQNTNILFNIKKYPKLLKRMIS